jgi:hypothetical protein
MITQYKIKLSSFSADLSEPLDREARTLITCECDIYEDAEQTNNDGTYNKVYKAKVNGSTIVKQGDKKPILAKSKRTSSQKLRQAIWSINPDETFYEIEMAKITANIEEIIEYLKDK